MGKKMLEQNNKKDMYKKLLFAAIVMMLATNCGGGGGGGGGSSAAPVKPTTPSNTTVVKEATKVEAPKVEEKPVEPKVEETKEEPKVEEIKEEPKVEEKPVEPKVEETKEEPKVEEKPVEPKVEETKEEPKVEEKPVVKVEEKLEEPKVEETKKEEKTPEKEELEGEDFVSFDKTEEVLNTINNILTIKSIPNLTKENIEELPEEYQDKILKLRGDAEKCFEDMMQDPSFREVIEEMVVENAGNEPLEARKSEVTFEKFVEVLKENLDKKVTAGFVGTKDALENSVEENDREDNKIIMGIVDGDFTVNRDELLKKYSNLEILNKELEEEHAEKVVEVLNEETFEIVAASIKNEKGKLEPKKSVYEKLFEKLDKNPQAVKVVNQSWGSPNEWAIGSKTVAFMKEKINEDNALFIWANGNRAQKARNTYQARRPKDIKGLEKGWLAVIGVDENNSHFEKHLAYADNDTRWWTISANGYGPERRKGNVITYGIGSSYAAPRVSRAAALVAAKYDWMTNSQVRQTLLTTTDAPERTDGERFKDEPTEKYGWGVLNEDRALQGPGAFYKRLLKAEGATMFRADIPADRITAFENDIHGDAGLIKAGDGRLLLKGNMTYDGATFVENGTVDIYQKHESDILVSHKGNLVLHDGAKVGKIKGTLLNVGRIKLGENNAEVTVKGNLQATGNSCIVLGGKSKLNIENNAELGHIAIEDTSFPTPRLMELENVDSIKNGGFAVIKVKGKLVDSKEAIEKRLEVNGMREVQVKIEDNLRKAEEAKIAAEKAAKAAEEARIAAEKAAAEKAEAERIAKQKAAEEAARKAEEARIAAEKQKRLADLVQKFKSEAIKVSQEERDKKIKKNIVENWQEIVMENKIAKQKEAAKLAEEAAKLPGLIDGLTDVIEKDHKALEAKDKEEQDKLAETLAKAEVEIVVEDKEIIVEDEKEEVGDVAIEPEENQKPPQPPHPDDVEPVIPKDTVTENLPIITITLDKESEPLEGFAGGSREAFDEYQENAKREYRAIIEEGGDSTVIYFVTSRKNAIEYFGEIGVANDVAEKIEIELKNIEEKFETLIKYDNTELAVSNELLEAVTVIVNATPEELKEASKNMAGDIYASAQSLTFKQASTVNRNLSNHLGDLKAFRNSGYDWQGWYTGFGSKGNLDKKGYASVDTDLRGTQFGLDKKLTPSTQVGVSMDYSYATADAAFGNKGTGNYKSDGVGISLYGKKYFADDSYVLGRVGAARYSTRVEREILDKNLEVKSNGNIKHHDVMLSTYVEAGKHYRYFTPFVGYAYDNLRRGSFAEKDAAWGIVADAKNYQRNTVVLGVRAEYEVASYRLNSHITHEINIGKRDLDFEGRYNVANTKSKFKGIEQQRDTTWVGVGVSKDITPQFSVDVKADMKFDGHKKSEVLGSVGVNYRF